MRCACSAHWASNGSWRRALARNDRCLSTWADSSRLACALLEPLPCRPSKKTGNYVCACSWRPTDAQGRSGRPVFTDFATDQGSIGIPADARSVITVGAADWQNQPRPYSAGGPLPFAGLAKKPAVLAYDGLHFDAANSGGALGSSIATSFAAGTVATLLSAGMTPADAVALSESIRRPGAAPSH